MIFAINLAVCYFQNFITMTIGQFTAMKNKLVFWTGEFLINITNWLQTNHPLFMQEWDDSVERSKEYLYSTGHNPYKYDWVVCLIDRMGEDEFTFNTIPSIS